MWLIGILNTFAGEYSDSVRVDYRVLEQELIMGLEVILLVLLLEI